MTIAGNHVRKIGEGVIVGSVLGLSATADMIVVSCSTKSKKIRLFDAISGDLIRSFGDYGWDDGAMLSTLGLRFTPHGGHILVCDTDNRRVSLFTLTGEFVRYVQHGCLKSPSDVDFASNGDILVSDGNNHRLCVFSSDGSTLLRTFGEQGDAPGQFQSPIALAVNGGHVFVLESSSNRVQLFN